MQIKDYKKEEIDANNTELICGSDVYETVTLEGKIKARKILLKNFFLKGEEDEYNRLIKFVNSK